jgi:hypothetical protein
MGGTIPSSLRPLHTMYLDADALAYHYQRLTYRTLWWMFILGFVTAVLFELNAHVVPQMFEKERASGALGWTLVAYLFLWAIILGLYWRAKRNHYQDKFRSYRALAEGLRVQFFWRLVGITDSIGDIFETRGSDEQIPVLTVIEHLASGAHPQLVQGPEREVLTVTQALVHWVEGQERYFTNAVGREKCLRKWLHRAEMGSFGVALAIPTWLLGWHIVATLGGEDHRRIALIVVSALAMVAAGLLHGYSEKRAFGEHIESYGEILDSFDDYKDVLRASDADGVRDRLREFGKTALRENADWVRLHRWRPLDRPMG